MADADAVVAVEDAPVAVNDALPAAVRSRWVVACTTWVAKVSAIAMPTAAPAESTSPVAVVVADARSFAVAVNAPVSTSGAPVPTTAVVVTFEVVIATTGAIAMFGDETPPCASVVAGAIADEVQRQVVRPGERRTVLETGARRVVEDVQCDRRADADGLAGDGPGRALTSLALLRVRGDRRHPRPPTETAPPGATLAAVFSVTTSTASEPATPTFDAPPAPEVEVAPNVFAFRSSAAAPPHPP